MTQLHPVFAQIFDGIVSDLSRETDVRRVRDGLQIAMDGLGGGTPDRLIHEILVCCHWLVDPSPRQDVAEEMTERLDEAATELKEWHR